MQVKQSTGSVAWHFGPDWPGKRCGAKTRSGTPCQRPGNKKTGRCRLHGGASTGPRTAAGRQKIADLHTTHGRFLKEKREEAKRRAQVGREIRAELRDIIAELIASGHLARDWREKFR